jgi:addiction module RelE/StbE family toxin
MIYETLLLKRAVEDSDAICRYLAQFYPGTAGRFLDELEQSIEGLAHNPYRYAEYEHNRMYRRMIVQDYLVFYKIFKTHKTIRIYRVPHGKRNIGAFLQ